MADDFDPDAYLASKTAPTADFDPDAYLASKAKPAEHSGALSNDGDGWGMGALKGAATGVIKGLANATPLTWAANSGNLADYVLARAESKFTGKPLDEVMAGMEAKRKAAADGSVLGRVREAIDPSKVLPSGEDVAAPVLKVTGEYKPESLPGKIAQGAVEAGVGGLGGGAGGVVRGAAAGDALRAGAALAPMNAVAGGAGAGVTDVTGDPLLGMAAGMVAPGAIDKAKSATSAKLRGFTQAGREEAVGARLRATADDPDAVAQALMADQSGPLQTELVPGSMPTAAELTGDMGLLEAQRHATNTDGVPFSKQRDAGSSARRQALENLSPDADVMKPGELFQSQLDAINKGGEAALARFQKNAQELAEPIGSGRNPEDNGAAIRAGADAVYQEIRAARQALYKAIDPDEKLNIVAAPAREKIETLMKSRDPQERPLGEDESRILNKVRSLPDVVPFKSLRALDSDITESMSQAMQAGQTASHGRLSVAKSAVMDAINNAVENQHAYEQAAVGVGKMKPQDTISARLEGLHDEYHGQLGRPSDAQGATGENAATGTSGLFGDGAGAGAEGGRSGIAPGGPSVSEGIPAARLPVERRREVAELRKKFGDAVADKYEAQQLRELAPKAAAGPDLNDFPIYYPGGNLRAKYQVMEHGDIVTSHDADFKLRPEYPQQLQPRARESAPARDQVNGMAAKIQPERLGPSPEANSGAPIVGPDGVVESGNGRALAIGQHYRKGGTEYRDWLDQQGFDTKGMKQPILVARRTSEMSPAQREYFAHSANSSGSLRMNAAEQAGADAKLISRDTVAKIGDLPITAAENRPFVRAFVDKLPAGERGGILDKDGNLSQAGERRLSAALASRAFDDAGFIGKAFDSSGSNIKQLASALTDAAGPWARMREAAHDGLIDPSHDVTHELMDVVKKVMRARDEGLPISDILKQNDMFGSDVKPLVEGLLFRDVDKGLLASRKRIGDGLKAYAVEAEKNLAGPRLFGDDVKPADVLKTAASKAAREPDDAFAATDAPTFDTGLREAPRGLQPNMDKAATDRLRAAKDKHIELAQTSRNPTIAPVLKTNGFAGQYKMRDSAVPSKAVLAGPQGYEAAKTFLKATKSEKPEVRDAATAALLDTALAPLREKMGNGMISQSNLDAWKQKHAGVLRALDEVSPGFSKRFDSAAKASDDLVAAGDSVKQEIADFQKSAASKLLGHRYPSEVEEAMGTLLMSKDGPSKIDALMKRADKDAIEGMQKAAVDYLVRKLTSAQEAGADGGKQLKGATFDNVLKNHKTALERLLPRDSIARMEKISRANEIASRQSLTRVVGGPGTAKDTNPIMKKIAKVAAHNNSLLGAALSGMYLGHTTGGLMGALAGGSLYPAAYAVAKLKAGRVETLDAMFRDAILSPERARYYWAKIPPKKPETGPLFALSKSLRRELATIPTLDLEEKRRPVKRAAGGSVMGSPPAYNQAVADALFG